MTALTATDQNFIVFIADDHRNTHTDILSQNIFWKGVIA
jgi:hypothetical protein